MFQWDMFEERLRRHEFEEWYAAQEWKWNDEIILDIAFNAFKAGYNLRQKKFDEDDGW